MRFSDEMVSAYADGELHGIEKAEFEQQLEFDIDLQESLENIYTLKQQLTQVYRGIKAPEQPQRHWSRYKWGHVASYVLVFMFSFSGGLMSGGMLQLSQQEMPADSLQQVKPGPMVPVAGGRELDLAQLLDREGNRADAGLPGKYILHVDMRDTQKFAQLMDQAERLLNDARYPTSLHLEVIANAGGIDLLRVDASPYVERIQQLSQRYPNVKFIACTHAIDRLESHGIQARLIPGVKAGPLSALDQVVKRIGDGWTYIKI